MLCVLSKIDSNSKFSFSFPGLFHSCQTKDRSQKTEAHIPPLLGVAPLGPVPLTKETQLQYQVNFYPNSCSLL